MSQFSPPPQNPNFGQPAGYGAPAPQPRTSAAAVTSLVLGILGCIPFVTSFFAIILGFVGIAATGKPNVTGRGMAIAGLILGFLGIVGWGITAAAGGWVMYETWPARQVAKDFLTDMSTGKVNEAAALCVPEMPRKSLDDSAETMKKWGALQDTTLVGASVNSQAGVGTEAMVSGSAIFGGTPRIVTIQFIKVNGVFKITKFDVH